MKYQLIVLSLSFCLFLLLTCCGPNTAEGRLFEKQHLAPNHATVTATAHQNNQDTDAKYDAILTLGAAVTGENAYTWADIDACEAAFKSLLLDDGSTVAIRLLSQSDLHQVLLLQHDRDICVTIEGNGERFVNFRIQTNLPKIVLSNIEIFAPPKQVALCMTRFGEVIVEAQGDVWLLGGPQSANDKPIYQVEEGHSIVANGTVRVAGSSSFKIEGGSALNVDVVGGAGILAAEDVILEGPVRVTGGCSNYGGMGSHGIYAGRDVIVNAAAKIIGGYGGWGSGSIGGISVEAANDILLNAPVILRSAMTLQYLSQIAKAGANLYIMGEVDLDFLWNNATAGNNIFVKLESDGAYSDNAAVLEFDNITLLIGERGALLEYGLDSVNHWAYDAIASVVEQGVLDLPEDYRFLPNKPASRLDIVTALGRIANIPQATNYQNTFSDVPPNSKEAPLIAWAARQGIVTGFSDGTFRGEESITREQLAFMIYQYMNVTDRFPADKTVSAPFPDDAAISNWAKKAVYAVRNIGIMGGKNDGSFHPQSTATRAEVCMILSQLL